MKENILKKELYVQKKAIIEAICHEIPISYIDAHKIETSFFDDEQDKIIIKTFKELFHSPEQKQPTSKKIADDIYLQLIRIGTNEDEAKKYADKIENLSYKKKAPDNGLLYNALRKFSIETSKPLGSWIYSDDDFKNRHVTSHKTLKKICADSNSSSNLDLSEDLIIDLFNSNHSVVRHGSKTLICEETYDHKENKIFEFSQIAQMKFFYSNLIFTYKAGKKTNEINLFDFWMKSIKRKEYYGIVFDPSCKSNNCFLNMWEGFNVHALNGVDKIQNILFHLKNIVCNSDENNYLYLIAWVSQMIQQPEIKSGVMIALRSDERGTGKSTLSVLLEKILGNHAIRIQDSKHLIGSFNNHLANKILVTIEEAFWSGSEKDAGKLRTMVTDSTITIEAKGRDVIEIDSYHRFLMCTNNEWTVPAHREERRYFVLDVSNKKKSNTAYFKKLYNEINNEVSIGQFFNYLKNFDITKFDLRKAPSTEALQEQIRQSMKTHEKWLEHILEDGSIESYEKTYDLNQIRIIPKSSFYDSYIRYCNDLNTPSYQRVNPRDLGVFINLVLKTTDTRPTINTKRTSCYQLLELKELIDLFNLHFKYK